VITPELNERNKCTKFQPNPTIFGLSRLPRKFSGQFGPRAQKGKFSKKKQKKKTPPDIHPRNVSNRQILAQLKLRKAGTLELKLKLRIKDKA